jgi:hypothetical protein
MYRIEVKPGEEAVFRTIEELATGIRNGFVTPRARIYHAASQKWLPIEFHPHYKKALDGNFTPTTPAPQPSLSAMPAPTFSFPGASSPGQAPVTPAAPEPVAAPAPKPSSKPASQSVVAPEPEPEEPRSSAPVVKPLPWQRPAKSTTAAESPVLAMQAAVIRPARNEADAESGPVERYSPVAVLEAPRPMPAPAPAPAPEVVLPNISYPELPASEATEPRATARRSRRTAGRPLLLVGSAALLVFAGQRFLAARGQPSSEPAAIADVATPSAPTEAPRATPVPLTRTKPGTAQPTSASARPAPAQAGATQPMVKAPSGPMSPGPAFAASVPARAAPGSPSAAASTPPPSAGAPATPAPAAPRADSTAIAPAPTSIQLDVPGALPGESIGAFKDDRDSLTIKRILKAVTDRKANPTTP